MCDWMGRQSVSGPCGASGALNAGVKEHKRTAKNDPSVVYGLNSAPVVYADETLAPVAVRRTAPGQGD